MSLTFPNILRTQTNGVWMGKRNTSSTKTVENVEGRISPTAHKFIDQHTHAWVLAQLASHFGASHIVYILYMYAILMRIMSQSYFKDRYEYKRNAWIIGWRVNSKFRLGTQKNGYCYLVWKKNLGRFMHSWKSNLKRVSHFRLLRCRFNRHMPRKLEKQQCVFYSLS